MELDMILKDGSSIGIASHTDLQTLYERSIKHYRAFLDEKFMVIPSIPVLHFGDLKKFQKSKRKIVTVGLNPSLVEFEENRFTINDGSGCSITELENALSNYFTMNPYSRWFNRSFEKFLQAFDASFYGDYYPKAWCQSGGYPRTMLPYIPI
jgi:hypothetical protein